MDLLSSIQRRRSSKTFLDKTPTKEQLQPLLEAARFAHSIGNKQVLRYTLCINKTQCRNIAQYANLSHINELPDLDSDKHIAPAYIICKGPISNTPSIYADLGAAFQNMALAAMTEKLAMFWISQFNTKPLNELLTIPEDQEVLALFAIGFPAESSVAYNADFDEGTIENNLDSRIIRIPKLRTTQISNWVE